LKFDRYRLPDLESTLKAVRGGGDGELLGSAAGLEQLVHAINKQIRRANISWKRFSAAEFEIPAAERNLPHNSLLADVPVATLRCRAAVVMELSKSVSSVLPAVDFRGEPLRRSVADLLITARGFLLHDMKVERLCATLNETAQRFDNDTAPEITLNPLETVGDGSSAEDSSGATLASTQFMQSLLQMDTVDPVALRVKLASGGDPIFPVVVRFTGEQVAGTSGSFRDFLGRMVSELRERKVPVFMECPSSSMSARNVDKNILRPGPLPFPVAKMLEFVGQLIGIALRADVPFPLDLLPSFWKMLAAPPGSDPKVLLSLEDIRDADWATGQLLVRVRAADTEDAFAALLAAAEEGSDPELQSRLLQLPPVPIRTPGSVIEQQQQPAAASKTGGAAAQPALVESRVSVSSEVDAADEVVPITWENRAQFIEELENLRYTELAAESRMAAVRRGLQTVVPLDLLGIMAWEDLEYRVCGDPEISLEFLRANTNYTGGLSEADPHIRCFWSTLESFTAEELQAFVKFACNQERIPSACPPDSPAPPPFPMKIAPADRSGGSPDGRYIRAETCMFMIKLPQYSSQELMTERLLFAIHCRTDPLIG